MLSFWNSKNFYYLNDNLFNNKMVGYGCQLAAISTVSYFFYEAEQIDFSPPYRKREVSNKNIKSLRRLVKEELQIDTPDLLTPSEFESVVNRHPELTVTCASAYNYPQYGEILIEALDNELLPIVYFDIDIDSLDHPSAPTKVNGGYIHAAIVNGYKITSDEDLYFHLNHRINPQWVLCQDLFESSNQLPVAACDTNEEKVIKVNHRRNEGGWFPESKLHRFFSAPNVVATKNLHCDFPMHGFANKIYIIEPSLEKLSQQLGKYIALLESSTKDLARAKAKILKDLDYELSHIERDSVKQLIESWKRLPSGYDNKSNWDLTQIPVRLNSLNLFDAVAASAHDLINNYLTKLELSYKR